MRLLVSGSSTNRQSFAKKAGTPAPVSLNVCIPLPFGELFSGFSCFGSILKEFISQFTNDRYTKFYDVVVSI